ncbi:MAG TPA: hypothetical protein VIL00_14635 [Pseudonocardiaceae bacterium]
MKRLVSTLIGGALVAVLAGCADEGGVGFGGAPQVEPTTTAPSSVTSEPAVMDPLMPQPPEGARALAEAQVDATALPEDYPRLVWTPEGDANAVGMYGREGGCGKVSAEVTEQTPKMVRVVLTETVPAKPQMCTMDLRFPPLTVQLDTPLGERVVVLEAKRVEQ